MHNYSCRCLTIGKERRKEQPLAIGKASELLLLCNSRKLKLRTIQAEGRFEPNERPHYQTPEANNMKTTKSSNKNPTSTYAICKKQNYRNGIPVVYYSFVSDNLTECKLSAYGSFTGTAHKVRIGSQHYLSQVDADE